jgi:hypothetical protein
MIWITKYIPQSLLKKQHLHSALNASEIEDLIRKVRDSQREMDGYVLCKQFAIRVSEKPTAYLCGSIATQDSGSEIIFWLQPSFGCACWIVLAPIATLVTFLFYDSENFIGTIPRMISLLVPQTPGFPILHKLLICSGPMFMWLAFIFLYFAESFRLEKFIIQAFKGSQ